MGLNNLYKLKKYLISFGAFFIVGFLDIIVNLFEGYRWRGFLPRVVVSILVYKFGKAGSPEDYATGPASGKLILASFAIIIYAVCKLIYDYTKAGKEAEEKRRKDWKNGKL